MMCRRQRIKRFWHRKDGHDGGADIGAVSLDECDQAVMDDIWKWTF